MNWKLLYPARSYYKVSLPTYSYTKSRCWISIPEKHIELVERREALPSLQEAGHYYQPEWVRRDMDDKRTEPIDGKTVFFRTTAPLSARSVHVWKDKTGIILKFIMVPGTAK